MHHIQRDDELIAHLITLEAQFWEYVMSAPSPTIRDDMSLVEAVKKAKEELQLRLTNGVDQCGLDAAAESGFANGAFANTAEKWLVLPMIFLLGKADAGRSEGESDKEGGQPKPTMTVKLQEKIDQKLAGRSVAGHDVFCS